VTKNSLGKAKCALSFVVIVFCLSLSFAGVPANRVIDQAEPAVERDLLLFGPAAPALTAAGFKPKGKITLFPREEIQGLDQIRVEVEGLPGNTGFTIFLSELNTVPFGSLQYIAEVSTDSAGRGSVTARLVVKDAFALKTDLNLAPPPVFNTPINVDLNHVVLWFADSSADDAFTTAGTGPFDSDRDSGIAVLRTIEPLP
jgi:hypothetical protein